MDASSQRVTPASVLPLRPQHSGTFAVCVQQAHTQPAPTLQAIARQRGASSHHQNPMARSLMLGANALSPHELYEESSDGDSARMDTGREVLGPMVSRRAGVWLAGAHRRSRTLH